MGSLSIVSKLIGLAVEEAVSLTDIVKDAEKGDWADAFVESVKVACDGVNKFVPTSVLSEPLPHADAYKSAVAIAKGIEKAVDNSDGFGWFAPAKVVKLINDLIDGVGSLKFTTLGEFINGIPSVVAKVAPDVEALVEKK